MKEKIIIIIYTCNRIITIFLGPFLLSYFMKLSTNNVAFVSSYNILQYFFYCLFGIILGSITAKNSLKALRLGIISRFLCILVIMLFGKNVISYYGLVAFFYGFSTMFFYLPFNLYRTKYIENKTRDAFDIKLNIIRHTVSILIPSLLGFAITTTNYIITACIVSIFLLIELILSFHIKDTFKEEYNLYKALNHFLKNKQTRKMFIVEFLNGILFSDAALGSLMTILILLFFKTDLNLGIINSLLALLELAAICFYTKHYKNKNDKNLIIFLGIILFVSSLLFSTYMTGHTLVIYNLILSFTNGILTFIYTLRLFNMGKEVSDNLKTEYWVTRELALNLGRVSGFLLLLLLATDTDKLIYFFILLNFIILVFVNILSKINKNES